VEPFSEPVCVVIADDGIAEDDVRHHLGDSLPLRVVWWGGRDYLATVKALRPAVIVVLGADEGLAHDRCRLVACLFSGSAPTVMSATLLDAPSSAPHLLVQQLGASAAVQIASLGDVELP
jgi:hypothetical protein